MKQAKALGVQGRFKAFEPLIAKSFDVAAMTKFAVGPRWPTLSDADHAALSTAFAGYIAATYAKNFDGFGGERFVVDPAIVPRGADAIVKSRIVPASGAATDIAYRLRGAGAAARVVDIYYSGGISEMTLRRADFGAVLAGTGPRCAGQAAANADRRIAQIASPAASSAGLNTSCGNQGPAERDHQQDAHAGGARMVRQRQRPERDACRQPAEQHAARQARRLGIALAAPPCHDQVDVERHADAEHQRQCDDIGEVERDAGDDTCCHCGGAREQDRQQGQADVAGAAQHRVEQRGDDEQRQHAGSDGRPGRSCVPIRGSRSACRLPSAQAAGPCRRSVRATRCRCRAGTPRHASGHRVPATHGRVRQAGRRLSVDPAAARCAVATAAPSARVPARALPVRGHTGGATASRSRVAARRAAGGPPNGRSLAATVRRLSIVSVSRGSAGVSNGVSTVSRSCAVSSRMARLSAWSAGTKLDSVTACATSGRRAEARGHCRRGARIGEQDLDRVGRVGGIAQQVGQRAHRFARRIAQVERVEVEPQPRQGGKTGNRHRGRRA